MLKHGKIVSQIKEGWFPFNKCLFIPKPILTKSHAFLEIQFNDIDF